MLTFSNTKSDGSDNGVCMCVYVCWRTDVAGVQGDHFFCSGLFPTMAMKFTFSLKGGPGISRE